MKYNAHCLRVVQDFDEFALATTEIDYNKEDLCVYCVDNVTNYYWLNIESIWGQIAFVWDTYENKGHFNVAQINYNIIPVIPDPERLLSFENLFSIYPTSSVTFLDSGFTHIHTIGNWGTAPSQVIMDISEMIITELNGCYNNLYLYGKLDSLITLSRSDVWMNEGGIINERYYYFPIDVYSDNTGFNIDLTQITTGYDNYFVFNFKDTESEWTEDLVLQNIDEYPNDTDAIYNNRLDVTTQNVTLKYHKTTVDSETRAMTPIKINCGNITSPIKLTIDAIGTNGVVQPYLTNIPTSAKACFSEIDYEGVTKLCYYEPFMQRDSWPIFTPEITQGNSACILYEENDVEDDIIGTTFYGNVINTSDAPPYTFDLTGLDYWSFFPKCSINVISTTTEVTSYDDFIADGTNAKQYEFSYVMQSLFGGGYMWTSTSQYIYDVYPTINNIDCERIDISYNTSGINQLKTNTDTIKIKNCTIPFLCLNKNLECNKFKSIYLHPYYKTTKVKLLNNGNPCSIGNVKVGLDIRDNTVSVMREFLDLSAFNNDIDLMIERGITMTSLATYNIGYYGSPTFYATRGTVIFQPCIFHGGSLTLVNYRERAIVGGGMSSLKYSKSNYPIIALDKILAIKDCSIDVSYCYYLNDEATIDPDTGCEINSSDCVDTAAGVTAFFNKFILTPGTPQNTYQLRLSSAQYALCTSAQIDAWIDGGYDVIEVIQN